MKSVRTEGCHVGLFREFVGTACCTYGQSNTTIVTPYGVIDLAHSWLTAPGHYNKPMLICCQLDPKDTFQWNFNQISGTFVQDNAWLKILAVCTSISSHFQYMDLSLFFRLEHLLYEIKKNPKTLAGCYLDWMEYKTDGNNTCHDDVMMYMETLSASLTLCEGNPSFTCTRGR